MTSKQPPEPDTLRGVWYYVYGKGSHLNIAGKIFLGVPMFPLIAATVLIYFFLNVLFTKKDQR